MGRLHRATHPVGDRRRPARHVAHLLHLLRPAAGRSGPPLRRQVAHGGDDRGGTGGVRPRQALVRAVRDLPQEPRHRRRVRLAGVRVLIRNRRPREGRARRADAADALPRHRCGDALGDHGHHDRGDFRDQARLPPRPGGHGLRPLRSLRARLLARARRPLSLHRHRRRARVAAGVAGDRICARSRRARRSGSST